MIRFACPTCRKVLKAPEHGAGRKISCPRCGQRLLIPPPIPVQNKTVLGQSMPDSTAPRVPPGFTVGAPSGPRDSDNLVLLGLVKDTELEGKELEQPSPKPERTWVANVLAIFALALGVAAMPVAFIYNLPLGTGLAWLGVLLGIIGMFAAVLMGRGRGFGLSFVGSAVCGSFLFAAIMLLRTGLASDDRRAQADTPKQPLGDAGEVAKKDPKEKPEGHGAEAKKDPKEKPEGQGRDKVEEGGTGTGKGQPPDTGKDQPPTTPAPSHGVIRLSGIRKQPDFLGRVFSDLDLWKDNPVEADARWKGKVVEVEMSLNDLEIKTRADGLAFLLTEDTPFWRAAGLQHAAFVFAEKNRPQLVGLHKQEGSVVIRGKCEGLVRGRVTFEDCVIVQKPVPAKTEEEVKQKRKVEPRFDSDDLERTARWGIAAAEALIKEVDNAIRFRDAVKKFEEEARTYAGKRVRWMLEVDSISENFVALRDRYKFGRPAPGLLGAAFAELDPHIHLEDADRKGSRDTEFALRVGQGISRDKAAQLRPGNKVTITAEVINVKMEGAKDTSMLGVGIHVKITLKGMQTE
jgi:hypothetical protein